MSRPRLRTRWFPFVAALYLTLPSAASAQDEYVAQSTSDPQLEIPAERAYEIPLDRLRVRVKPLTAAELEGEAAAWFELVRAWSFEIRAADLSAKTARAEEAQAKEEAAAAAEEVAAAQEAEQDGAVPAPTTTQQAEQVKQQAEAEAAEKQEEKQAQAERAVQLREQRVKLLDRFDVVLTAWAAKGGDREEYDRYIDAISGFEIDVSDTASAWTAVRGWLLSPEGGLRWGRNIGFFILTVVLFWILAAMVGAALARVLRRASKLTELLRSFLVMITKRAILIVGFVFALQALEVNISPLVAAIGGAAFVVAFALQGTLSNFASGILLLVYRPFDVGHVIEAAGVTGKVEAMNLVSTIVATFDNQVIMVPNNAIWGGVITNITGRSTRRVDMTFGIGYGDDIGKAIQVFKEILDGHPKVLKDPAPNIQVSELGDSSVNFIVRPWSQTADYWEVYWDVTRQVKERLDAAGISIPFPQRDVHIYNEPAGGE